MVAATHIQLGQRVALKFLLPSACADGQSVARFLREARAAVQIQSEHVARVLDVKTLDTGAPYIVMELLRAHDLQNVLRRDGPLPVSDVVDYVLQACEALAEAHALGIVHRDLKPANLFLSQRPDGSPLVKVLDFGVSKAIDAAVPGAVSLTSTVAVLGSPLYMSPEQIRNAKRVDARTDIWSLGVTLFELLSGHPAFHADTLAGLLAAIAADPPQSLRGYRPDVPAGLEQVILQCLEKDVSRRIPTMGRLAQALAPFGSTWAPVVAERIARLDRAGGEAVASAAEPVWAAQATSAEPTGLCRHEPATHMRWKRGNSDVRLRESIGRRLFLPVVQDFGHGRVDQERGHGRRVPCL